MPADDLALTISRSKLRELAKAAKHGRLDQLGEGHHRIVYAYPGSDKLVVKIDRNEEKCFHNVGEWQMWESFRGTWLEQWVAPAMFISRDGHTLISKRVAPIRRRRDLPKMVPYCFAVADCKPEQWGILDGRPVCLDYGIVHIHIQVRSKPLLLEPQWLT